MSRILLPICLSSPSKWLKKCSLWNTAKIRSHPQRYSQLQHYPPHKLQNQENQYGGKIDPADAGQKPPKRSQNRFGYIVYEPYQWIVVVHIGQRT